MSPASASSDVAAAAAPAIAPPAVAPDPHLCPACKQIHAGSEAATLNRLAQTPVRLGKLLNGLDSDGWKKSYGPGKWTIRQILAHLRDCELVFSVRWRKMISEDEATLTPFDQDCWANATNYAKHDAKRAYATLKLLRATNLELLKVAGKGALARVGIHGEYGAITVGQMARHALAHDENHLAQIAQARASGKATRNRKPARKRAASR